MSSPDRQAPGMPSGSPRRSVVFGGGRSHPGRLPNGDARPPPGRQTMELFDALAVVQHGGAQATGMTPWGGKFQGVTRASGRHQGVRRRPMMTPSDHRPRAVSPVQRANGGRNLEGDGRVGLYAGFCPGDLGRRGRPSISACRCRQALAAYPQARASSPRTPAPAAVSRPRPCLALLRVGFTEPPRSPGVLVSSYLTVSPLPAPRRSVGRRSVLCGTFPRVAPGCR